MPPAGSRRSGQDLRDGLLVPGHQQVHPGHAGDLGHLLDDLGRELDALGRLFCGRHVPQPLEYVVGHFDPGHVALHVVQGLDRADRADPGQDRAVLGQAQVADLRHPPGEGRDVEHELGLHELRAGRDLLAQPVGPELHRRGERVLHRAQEAVRRRVELASGQQDVLVAHGAQGPQQLHAVQVEHRLGARVVAELRVITGHDQDVPDAQSRRAEQVGLQRDAVTVPAGHLHDRLEPGVEDGEAAGPAGQAHVGALVVGDVDRVHPVFEASGGFGDLRRAGPAGRADLGGHREAARGQALAQAHGCRSGFDRSTGPRRGPASSSATSSGPSAGGRSGGAAGAGHRPFARRPRGRRRRPRRSGGPGTPRRSRPRPLPRTARCAVPSGSPSGTRTR